MDDLTADQEVSAGSAAVGADGDATPRAGARRVVAAWKASEAANAGRVAEEKEKSAAASKAIEKRKAYDRYAAKFGWTDEQFEENWKLRDVNVQVATKGFVLTTKWDQLIDRERKRIAAPPRKNADWSLMPDGGRAHRRAQNAAAQKATRARKADEKDMEALRSGKRPLTDEELEIVKAIDAEKAQPPVVANHDPELAALIAHMKEAQRMELAAKSFGRVG